MVATIKVRTYSDRWIAEFEERQAIRNEHHLYNRRRYHNPAKL